MPQNGDASPERGFGFPFAVPFSLPEKGLNQTKSTHPCAKGISRVAWVLLVGVVWSWYPDYMGTVSLLGWLNMDRTGSSLDRGSDMSLSGSDTSRLKGDQGSISI